MPRTIIVVIGASLGGVAAIRKLLSKVPKGFPAPILIVQHRHKTNEQVAEAFREVSALPVVEPNDKEPLQAGHIYVAPPDYHMLVESGHLALSVDDPVNYSRPSIDVLFESAAEAYGRDVVGVILTGANRDGASGCARIKARGGVVLAQAVEEAECGTMPAAAIAATHVDQVLPVSGLVPALCKLCPNPR